MKSIYFIVIICGLIVNCGGNGNNLYTIEPIFRTYDFAGLEVYGSIEDGLRSAKINKKPIFLLFSGYACVGDKSYEEELFIKNENRKIIEKNYVPVILFVDDKIELEQSKIELINEIDGNQKIKTVGDKNAIYQQERFCSNSQPLMVILDHNDNEIIAPIEYQVSSFLYQQFLINGIERYEYLYNSNL